jgi:hypothetical protein
LAAGCTAVGLKRAAREVRGPHGFAWIHFFFGQIVAP